MIMNVYTNLYTFTHMNTYVCIHMLYTKNLKQNTGSAKKPRK